MNVIQVSLGLSHPSPASVLREAQTQAKPSLLLTKENFIAELRSKWTFVSDVLCLIITM